jgi:hypothetical protein
VKHPKPQSRHTEPSGFTDLKPTFHEAQYQYCTHGELQTACFGLNPLATGREVSGLYRPLAMPGRPDCSLRSHKGSMQPSFVVNKQYLPERNAV